MTLRLFYLFSIYLLFALDGVAQAVTPTNGAVDPVFTIVLASSATLWALADSSRRGRTLMHSVQLVMFLFWPLTLPAYLVGTRGWRGLGLTLLHAMGLCLTLGGFFFVAEWLVYGVAAQ